MSGNLIYYSGWYHSSIHSWDMARTSVLWEEHTKAIFNLATIQLLKQGRANPGIPVPDPHEH